MVQEPVAERPEQARPQSEHQPELEPGPPAEPLRSR
jgi:hypothetical protein